MDLEGRVIENLGETSGTSKAGNPWKKKEWVIETFGNFPKKVKVQCFGDRADSINMETGKDYVLSIDIESREYNGRWYTDVSVFRVAEYMGPQGIPAPQPGMGGGYSNPATQQTYNMPYGDNAGSGAAATSFQQDESEEDLPF